MKPANRLPVWAAVAALLFGLLFRAGSAAARGASTPSVASAALAGTELGLLASGGGPAAAQAAPPTPAPAAAQAAAPAPAPDASPAAPPAPAPTASPAAPPASPPAASPATATPTPTPQPNGHVIFIDPGHGGSEIGAAHSDASGREDVIEKDVNLAIGLRLADMLRESGYTVQMDRTTDTRPVPDGPLAADLQARADQANQAGADLFICIHNNGAENPTQQGTEVYYCSDRPFSAENLRLATLLQQALVRNIRQAGYDTVDRGVKDDSVIGGIAVLAPDNLARPSTMPGVLGESLFLSNDEDAAALARSDIQDAVARAYLEAIQAYFDQP